MPGRRWSDGLHQAVEAKEKVKIERENQTLATITFQNYFRKYSKLSGMTGTADTEAEEFAKIYKLDVVVIPTNRPLTRIEEPDLVYRTEDEKFEAIVADVAREAGRQGRPVLVGTVSVEKSERLSGMLQAARRQARRAERQVPRAGSRDRRPGRPQGRGHRRHQHGRPRHRHPARRQRRVHGAPADARRRSWPSGCRKTEARFVDDDEFVYFFHLDNFYRVPRAQYEPIFADAEAPVRRRARRSRRRRRPAHRRHRAPRGAPHRQPAARPRRPPGRSRARRASTCRSKTT